MIRYDRIVAARRARGSAVASAALTLAYALVSCSTSTPVESNQVWFEAEPGGSARVISQGPGAPLMLACDAESAGESCTWTVRLVLRNVDALSRWSLDVTNAAEAAGLTIDGVELTSDVFDAPSDEVSTGAGSVLLTGAGAARDAVGGVAPGRHVLMTFTLKYAPDGDPSSAVVIGGEIGAGGWLLAEGGTAAVSFGSASATTASAGRPIPTGVIILNPILDPSDPEVCDDGMDNDGDGRTDCGDPDCENQAACEEAPRVVCPADVTVECDGSGHVEQIDEWLVSADLDGPCAEPDVTSDFDGLEPTCGSAGFATVTWRAAATCGSHECKATFTIEDTTPPTIERNGPESITLECGVDRYDEFGAAVHDDCDSSLTEPEIRGDVVNIAAPGEYEIRYSATDACGNESMELTRIVEVVDTLPPELQFQDPIELWPPDHEYVTLSLSDCFTLIDACDGEIALTFDGGIRSIYSDEAENANGDGNTTDDIVILSDTEFMVRAERRGSGNGRVYGVEYEAQLHQLDQRIEGTCLITVPHDQSGDPAIDDGPGAGYVVGE